VVSLSVAWLDYMQTRSGVTISNNLPQSSSSVEAFRNRCYAQAAVGKYHMYLKS